MSKVNFVWLLWATYADDKFVEDMYDSHPRNPETGDSNDE